MLEVVGGDDARGYLADPDAHVLHAREGSAEVEVGDVGRAPGCILGDYSVQQELDCLEGCCGGGLVTGVVDLVATDGATDATDRLALKVDLDLDLGVVVGSGAAAGQSRDEDHGVGAREQAVELDSGGLFPEGSVRSSHDGAVADGGDGVRCVPGGTERVEDGCGGEAGGTRGNGLE